MSDHTPKKEGLQSAIDFTKFLLTLAGGAIAFVIQPAFFQESEWTKALSISALVLLTICVGSGLAVFSAGSVNLAKGSYDLDDNWVKIPGIVNVASFASGFLCIAVAIGIKIIRA